MENNKGISTLISFPYLLIVPTQLQSQYSDFVFFRLVTSSLILPLFFYSQSCKKRTQLIFVTQLSLESADVFGV